MLIVSQIFFKINSYIMILAKIRVICKCKCSSSPHAACFKRIRPEGRTDCAVQPMGKKLRLTVPALAQKQDACLSMHKAQTIQDAHLNHCLIL